MTKKKITHEMYSYGLYSKWERKSKHLPKLIDITDRIAISDDIEFGYVLRIRGAKGKRIQFVVYHPPFKDENGKKMEPFEGEYFINSNDYEFFLGDTVWHPLEDKAGIWELVTYIEGKEIARKKLTLYIP